MKNSRVFACEIRLFEGGRLIEQLIQTGPAVMPYFWSAHDDNSQVSDHVVEIVRN
jgi:hypothetical protein